MSIADAALVCKCTSDLSSPICGTNGKTYNNLCELKCAQTEYSGLEKAYDGPCKQICHCPQIAANVESTVTDQKVNCSTGACVCGTDGNTYATECALTCAQATNPDLKEAYDGPCKVNCFCEIISSQATDASTNVDCSAGECICGTDGITYLSGCQFICAQTGNPNLKVANDGPCQQICNCPFIPADGVATTDQKIYPIECLCAGPLPAQTN